MFCSLDDNDDDVTVAKAPWVHAFEYSLSKVWAAMSEGVVTPSLLPPPIISAGWIKSPLHGHPKALWACWTLTPDLIYPRDPSLSVFTVKLFFLVNPSQRQSPWFVAGFFQDRSLSWISKKDSLLFFLCFYFFCWLPVLWLGTFHSLSAHHHMLTWLTARRQRVLNISNRSFL